MKTQRSDGSFRQLGATKGKALLSLALFLLILFCAAEAFARVPRIFNVRGGETVRLYAKWMKTSSHRVRNLLGLRANQGLADGAVVSIPMSDATWKRFRKLRKRFRAKYRPPKVRPRARRTIAKAAVKAPAKVAPNKSVRVATKAPPITPAPPPKAVVKRAQVTPTRRATYRGARGRVRVFHGPDGAWIEHKVRSGEFLIRIAQRYGVDPQDVRDANGGRSLTRIVPHEFLIIPVDPAAWTDGLQIVSPKATSQQSLAPSYSMVKIRLMRGETMSQVSLLSGLSIQTIMALNGIERAKQVRSGQRVWVPVRRAKVARFKKLRRWWKKKREKARANNKKNAVPTK